MSHTDESRTFPAELEALTQVHQFVCQQAQSADAQDTLRSKLELVVEEVFVNIINHARPRHKPEVEVTCSLEQNDSAPSGAFCVALRDWGPPFNPLDQQQPNLELSVEERAIGGLGIHLVKQMADRCEYRRENDSNLFSICFYL
ncbi:conserved protein of unknown function [Pseudodesulfovibrio profundus]|uniref:Histidine kinase/HSP90-like ATPase domain-containing protein n=1 Tax=Pseudodesulfovibrio profundus TaxID=57320 RepID=A0A2C8FE19_9BACT|nr:ATP-binding protein [Pseudodesulfovibrio profundus]SOB60416.1 conserved protein of unknown function [Pseudodesulfovibrio profundus]